MALGNPWVKPYVRRKQPADGCSRSESLLPLGTWSPFTGAKNPGIRGRRECDRWERFDDPTGSARPGVGSGGLGFGARLRQPVGWSNAGSDSADQGFLRFRLEILEERCSRRARGGLFGHVLAKSRPAARLGHWRAVFAERR